MKSRKRIVKLFLGLGAIYMAIFVACMTRGSYGPLQQPLPEGTILFTTGSIDNVYLVGLPSCKCTHLDLKQAKLNLHSEPEQHEPEITKVSGPRNGVLAILLRQDLLLIGYKVGDTWERPKWTARDSMNIRQMALSPDGRYLAYTQWPRNVENEEVIGILDLVTGHPRILAKNGATGTGPGSTLSWSADGSILGVILSMAVKDMPPFEPDSVPGYLARTKVATVPVACRIRLATGQIDPVSVASSIVFGQSDSHLYFSWNEWYCSDAVGETPHKVVMPECPTAVLPGNLALIALKANGDEGDVPIFGKRPVENADSFIHFEADILAVRISTTDGRQALPIARVQPASDDWDAPSGFAMSFGD